MPKLHRVQPLPLLALPLALLLCLLLPGQSAAHAILLRSDPASNAILNTTPEQVRMWFSENLNPATSTATIVNTANQRVDINGALVIPTNTREMDVSPRPDLLPGIYVVTWHTQSAADGHIFSGSFLFSIANPGGIIPPPSGPLPDHSQFATTLEITIFRLLMLALVDLCSIFWVSGQVWHMFILDPPGAETTEQRAIEQLTQQRFARRFSLPILRVLFLANIGVLLGQALSLTEGRWDLALSPTLLVGLLTNGNFGTFWLIAEAIIGLMLMLETFIAFARQHAQSSNNTWLEVLLGLALLITTTLSSRSATTSTTPTIIPILIDGLYLLAAALWLGSMFYLSLVYLHILTARPLVERIHSLLTTLHHFMPFAISGVIIMTLSGTFNATTHLTSLAQLSTTSYGHILIIQFICIIALLAIGVVQTFLLQPKLAQAYKKYASNEQQQTSEVTISLLEQDVLRQANRITTVLRFASLLGIIVILCAALLSILAGAAPPTQLINLHDIYLAVTFS